MMKRLFYLLPIAISAIVIGCTKEVVGTQGEVIATKVVSAEKGSFTAAIQTYGVWQAVSMSEWLHVTDEYKKGNYALTINYDSNESTEAKRRFNRIGNILIKTYDGFTTDTIRVMQEGLQPIIMLQETEVPAAGGEVIIPLNTNLTDEERPAIRCAADAAWAYNVRFGTDNRSVIATVEANGGAERQCKISMSFTDAWGQVTESTCTLIQLQQE